LVVGLLPAFLLGTAARVHALHGCVSASVDRDGCCCRTAHTATAPSKIERQCCCEVDAPSAPATPIPTAAGAPPHAAPAPVALAAIGTIVPRAWWIAEAVAPPARPPGTGPPLILLTRSFRI
jgi:hypothetical protein